MFILVTFFSFSDKYFFQEILELVDFDLFSSNIPEGESSCPIFHFMPRFVRELPGILFKLEFSLLSCSKCIRKLSRMCPIKNTNFLIVILLSMNSWKIILEFAEIPYFCYHIVYRVANRDENFIIICPISCFWQIREKCRNYHHHFRLSRKCLLIFKLVQVCNFLVRFAWK